MATPRPASASKRGPRPRFTRDEVLRAALALIDSTEPGTFTMRRLADELGIGVMTLYGYVASKEELCAAVTELAFGEIAPAPAMTGPWDEVRQAVRELHAICRRHPHLVTIVLGDTEPHPTLFRRRERILTALHDAGLDAPQALNALGVLYCYALGFAVAATARGLRELPADIRAGRPDFPALHGAAPNYAANLAPEAFEYGLELLIRGMSTP